MRTAAVLAIALVPGIVSVAASAEPGEATTLDGHPGLVRAPSLAPFEPGTLRVSVGGTHFEQSDFSGTDDNLIGTTSTIGLGWSIHRRVAVAVAFGSASYHGPDLVPREIQSFGDVEVSALVPLIAGFGVRPGVRFLSSTTGSDGYAESASPYLDLLGSRALGPVIFAGGAGYVLDRSEGVAPTGIVLDPAQRASYGVAEGAHARWNLALEASLGRVHPWVDYRGRFHAGASKDPPQIVGAGLRVVTPWAGRSLGVTAGVDLALAGTDPEPARPREPRVRGLVALSLSAAPARPTVAGPAVAIATPVPTPVPPAQGIVTGLVKDAESGEPLAWTTITFVGLPRNPVLTDALGRFRATEFDPGSARLRAQKQGYRPTVMETTVIAGETSDLKIELTSGTATVATVAGDVRSRGGTPLKAKLVLTGAAAKKELATDEAGRFRIDLPPGPWTLHVEAPGHSPQSKTVQLVAGELTLYNFLLSDGS